MSPRSTSAHKSASRSTSTSAKRAEANARDEIINMLKDDHKRARKAFREFEKLDPQDDEERCRQLVEQTCAELEVHAELEEEHFYPAARSALGEEDLVDEAEVEHMTFKMLIQQLKDLEVTDEKYAATFKVLGEYVKHHVKEEETEMFTNIARARINWASLLEDMQQARQQLLEEKGMAPEQETDAQAVTAAGAEVEDSQTPIKNKTKSKSKGEGARA